MKIAIVNFTDKLGGAAMAADRLAQKLIQQGHEVRYYAWVNARPSSYNYELVKPWQRKLERAWQIIGQKYGLSDRFTFFSPGSLQKKLAKFQPDVVNFHNIHGNFLCFSGISMVMNSYPVAWTLHDMWAFTGHCGYTYECEGFLNRCGNCPNLEEPPAIGRDTTRALWEAKNRAYSQAKFICLTPSEWMATEARKSSLLSKQEVRAIANGVDLGIFHPDRREKTRSDLNISQGKKVLIFGADRLGAKRKGGDLLVKILQELHSLSNDEYLVLTLGGGELESLNHFKRFEHIPLGSVSEQEKMSAYFSAADLMLFPTRADNLPNMLVESIASGTPCITYDVGGCPEIVKNGVSGYTLPPESTTEFARKVQEVFDSGEVYQLRDTTLEFARKCFDSKRMSREYLEGFHRARELFVAG